MSERPLEALGRRFTEAREKRGRSLREIADKTRIQLGTLEAIESGDHSALPAPVFVKGFLRAYALQLGLDPNEIILEYRTPAPEATKSPSVFPPRCASRFTAVPDPGPWPWRLSLSWPESRAGTSTTTGRTGPRRICPRKPPPPRRSRKASRTSLSGRRPGPRRRKNRPFPPEPPPRQPPAIRPGPPRKRPAPSLPRRPSAVP
ncbi:MAG: helix-turn-helix domain-containing protein [Proteobacteria bacterium]|nr:helix-turn-helix domain-containing protein [Pseudomonadota bacterium]